MSWPDQIAYGFRTPSCMVGSRGRPRRVPTPDAAPRLSAAPLPALGGRIATRSIPVRMEGWHRARRHPASAEDAVGAIEAFDGEASPRSSEPSSRKYTDQTKHPSGEHTTALTTPSERATWCISRLHHRARAVRRSQVAAIGPSVIANGAASVP